MKKRRRNPQRDFLFLILIIVVAALAHFVRLEHLWPRASPIQQTASKPPYLA